MNVEAYGQDFLEKVPDGTVFLSSPASKGWTARQERTPTRAEHPGTAVRWQGDVFEVVQANALPDGSLRYKLAPWDFRHAIRVIQSYDAASEQKHTTEHTRRRESIWKRRLSILFSPVLGHLPGPVQEKMESEFGAPARAMTIVSALPLLALGVVGVLSHLVSVFSGNLLADAGAAPGAPLLPWEPPLPIAFYLLMESGCRLGSTFVTGHPIGSLPGVLAYKLWSQWSGRRIVSPLSTAGAPATKPQAREDRYRMLEPLLALLSPQEQRLLEHRFGFESLRWGRITAVCLLVVSGFGVLTALTALLEGAGNLGDLLVLLVGAGLLLEQVRRQREFARGHPAGSVLARLVRPLARNLLSHAGGSE
ncbi:MAG: hypothetical protein ACRD1B_11195 [Thermoanaerobaculia bacterium]